MSLKITSNMFLTEFWQKHGCALLWKDLFGQGQLRLWEFRQNVATAFTHLPNIGKVMSCHALKHFSPKRNGAFRMWVAALPIFQYIQYIEHGSSVVAKSLNRNDRSARTKSNTHNYTKRLLGHYVLFLCMKHDFAAKHVPDIPFCHDHGRPFWVTAPLKEGRYPAATRNDHRAGRAHGSR